MKSALISPLLAESAAVNRLITRSLPHRPEAAVAAGLLQRGLDAGYDGAR